MNTTNTHPAKAGPSASPEKAPWRPEATARGALLRSGAARRGVWTQGEVTSIPN